MSKNNDVKLKTDLSKRYLVRMCKKGHEYEKPELVEVVVSKANYTKYAIKCEVVENKDAYLPSYFDDEYFQWLLHTNEIIEVE